MTHTKANSLFTQKISRFWRVVFLWACDLCGCTHTNVCANSYREASVNGTWTAPARGNQVQCVGGVQRASNLQNY